MAEPEEWAFYGRQTELGQLEEILSRRRWFFLQISGRRRIGKTTLIQQALLAAQLYEERSRLGLGDFALSERIRGYWDRSDVEIDLVAVSEDQKAIRFGSCKRQGEKLARSIPALVAAAERFLGAHKAYQGWNVDYVAIAPRITEGEAAEIQRQGAVPQSLGELCDGL